MGSREGKSVQPDPGTRRRMDATGPGKDQGEDEAKAFANGFVLVGLAAMLVGAVLVIAARDPYVRDVEPGDTALFLHYEAPRWDPWPRHIDATLSGGANATLVAEETTGTGKGKTMTEFIPGQIPDWEVEAEPGEVWRLSLSNEGNETLRVSGKTVATSFYYVGGALVAVGVLGFVSYRIGMRRSL